MKHPILEEFVDVQNDKKRKGYKISFQVGYATGNASFCLRTD